MKPQNLLMHRLCQLYAEIEDCLDSHCMRAIGQIEDAISDNLLAIYSPEECCKIIGKAGFSYPFFRECVAYVCDKKSIIDALCKVPEIKKELAASLNIGD